MANYALGGQASAAPAATYQDMLGRQMAGYGDALAGYRQVADQLNQSDQNVGRGYAGLSGTVMGSIQGIDAGQRQAITDAYAAQTGRATQGLINSGLGNTTVTSAVQRGLALDKAKADVALTNQTQQLTAGYQSQLGLAGLGFSERAGQRYGDLLSRGLAAREQQQLAGAEMASRERMQQEQLGLGYYQAGNQYQLGLAGLAQQGQQARGSLGLGYAGLAQHASESSMFNDLQARQANNQYELGLRSQDLQQQQLALGQLHEQNTYGLGQGQLQYAYDALASSE